MKGFIITINGVEYVVEADTRWKAVNKAAHRHRDETGAEYSIPVLIAIAHTRSKVDGRKRYPEVVL